MSLLVGLTFALYIGLNHLVNSSLSGSELAIFSL